MFEYLFGRVGVSDGDAESASKIEPTSKRAVPAVPAALVVGARRKS